MNVNVKDFGCIGDGVTDDRANFQHALDAGAGATVTVPPGRYLLSQGGSSWCIRMPALTTLVGSPGAVLVQAVVPGSVRLIQVDVPGVQIQDIALDGQRALQIPDEHRAGIFATAPGLALVRVGSFNFSGDGFTIHTGADILAMSNCAASNNGRSGVAFTGDTRNAHLEWCTFTGNRVKQIHTEPGAGCHVDDVAVIDCMLGSDGSSDYALSITGGGGAAPALSKGWTVTRGTIRGSVYMAGAAAVVMTDVTIFGMVRIYRNSDDIMLIACTVSAGAADPSAIEVFGTDAANIPDGIDIESCTIVVPDGMGIHSASARRVRVDGCALHGGGVKLPYAYGVYCRSIVPGSQLDLIAVDNSIYDFGSTGIIVADTGGGVASCVVSGNRFSSTVGGTVALNLPVGASATGNVAMPPMELGS